MGRTLEVVINPVMLYIHFKCMRLSGHGTSVFVMALCKISGQLHLAFTSLNVTSCRFRRGHVTLSWQPFNMLTSRVEPCYGYRLTFPADGPVADKLVTPLFGLQSASHAVIVVVCWNIFPVEMNDIFVVSLLKQSLLYSCGTRSCSSF